MNNPLRRKAGALWLALGASVLLTTALRLPLWQMRMEAPQYREEEALNVIVYPGALRGDMDEITVLNQYIGVHVPEELPQLKWLPAALIAAAVLGIGAALLPKLKRRYALVVVPSLLSLALLAAAAQAQWQMYQIGHRRDKKTTLVGVKDFTTPLLGTRKIAQFEVASSFGIGAYLVGAAIALQLGGAWLSRKRREGPQPEDGRAEAKCPSTWDAHLKTATPCPALQDQQ